MTAPAGHSTPASQPAPVTEPPPAAQSAPAQSAPAQSAPAQPAPGGPRPLAGRVALITGGSRGVGRAIARRLATDGAAVAVNYRRDQASAGEVVAAIEAGGGRAVAYQAAIGDDEAVRAMTEAVRSDLGDVDILVSNAGTASRGHPIAATEPEEYLRLLTVHTLGPVALIRSLLPAMRAQPRADIVVISSAITDHAPLNSAPYSMAKAALEMAARTLAREERAHGIRVNVVAPALVATDMGERLVRAVDGRGLHELDSQYPFGRVCRPEDVAGAVAFLVSQDADYLTGQRLVVDGGGTAPSIV
jgi:NAD(P)-dependent dehydrogenase (short-subunit alcohol dehydrogenase family)